MEISTGVTEIREKSAESIVIGYTNPSHHSSRRNSNSGSIRIRAK